MIEKAINKVLELAKVETIKIGNRTYASKGIIPVEEPTPETLAVHTLSGIVDYLNKKIDTLKNEKLVLHVVSPTEVNLLGFIEAGSFYERPEFLTAVFEPPNVHNGYIGLEDFIIGLQAYFVATDVTAAILKVVGNLKDSKVNQFEDDGVTQSVTAKVGIAVSENVKVPNPVKLRPFRTFPEIEQPESLFVFRMRTNPGQAPSCGLWEADNKLWKVEAIQKIATWLQDKVKDVPIIA